MGWDRAKCMYSHAAPKIDFRWPRVLAGCTACLPHDVLAVPAPWRRGVPAIALLLGRLRRLRRLREAAHLLLSRRRPGTAPPAFTLLLCSLLCSAAAAALAVVLLLMLVTWPYTPPQGHADVGFTDHPPSIEIQTPTMDKLVAQGVRLDRHYVHYTCTPTRSSIHSGRLPVHVTTKLSSPPDPNAGIPRNYTGMAEVLRRAGYATHFMGKW
jgi:hypothetical protein